jgi:hypothetical protein
MRWTIKPKPSGKIKKSGASFECKDFNGTLVQRSIKLLRTQKNFFRPSLDHCTILSDEIWIKQ